MSLINISFEDDRGTSCPHTTGYSGAHMHDPMHITNQGVEHSDDSPSVSSASNVRPPLLSSTVGQQTKSNGSENDNSSDGIGKHENVTDVTLTADDADRPGEVCGRESTDASLARFDDTCLTVEAVCSTTTSMEIIIPFEDDSTDTLLPPEMQDEDTEPHEIDVEGYGSDRNPVSVSDGSEPSAEYATQSWDHSQTIVCSRWQAALQFTNAGGTLQKPGSDVILHVPLDAVDKKSSVLICTAVCTDIDRINHVLNLPEEDVIVSPLVEYWAGRHFRFQHPVRINLPHILPPDYDLSNVRVYRAVKNSEGHVVVTRLRHLVDDGIHDDSDSSLNSREKSGTNEQNTRHPTPYVKCGNVEGVVEEKAKPTVDDSEKYTARSFKDQPEAEDVVWEENSYFQISSDGQVIISTDCFSCYVCTECKRSQALPVLLARAYGSHRREGGRRLAKIYLYVWDRRLEISDFREVSFVAGHFVTLALFDTTVINRAAIVPFSLTELEYQYM